MSMGRLFARRIEVPCTIEMAQTPETLHAHVDLQGVDIGPGDEVRVHDAPSHLAYDTILMLDSRATVVHASWLKRTCTRLFSRFELGLLYEVSFTPERWQPK